MCKTSQRGLFVPIGLIPGAVRSELILKAEGEVRLPLTGGREWTLDSGSIVVVPCLQPGTSSRALLLMTAELSDWSSYKEQREPTLQGEIQPYWMVYLLPGALSSSVTDTSDQSGSSNDDLPL